MATFTWEAFVGAGPTWTDIAANTLVFSGVGGLATPISVAAWQDETHLGSGTPGTDQCGANHANNVKYLTGSTMSVNGGGSEAINDTNLTENECSFRIHFNHTEAISATNSRMYMYDSGTGVTTEAPEVDAFAFERGVTATAWTEINNDDTGPVGGDNVGERLDLSNQGPATDLYWYIALSVSPETAAGKPNTRLGVNITYS
jgi:hypothetical protein